GDGVGTATMGDRDPDLSERLHELSSGWPAAVRLALEALRSAPPAERSALLGRLFLPGGGVFAYLADEVFGREPIAVRELLRRIAMFDRFTAELCTAIGPQNAPSILKKLRTRGLFVDADAGAPG